MSINFCRSSISFHKSAHIRRLLLTQRLFSSSELFFFCIHPLGSSSVWYRKVNIRFWQLRLSRRVHPVHHLLLLDEHLLEGIQMGLQVLQLHVAGRRIGDGVGDLVRSSCDGKKTSKICLWKIKLLPAWSSHILTRASILVIHSLMALSTASHLLMLAVYTLSAYKNKK